MSTALSARNITERFAQIRDEVDDVLRRREDLFITTHAELIAAGIESAIVTNVRRGIERGQNVVLWDEYRQHSNGSTRWNRSVTPHWSEHRRDTDERFGPYDYGWSVDVSHGVYEVLIIDDRKALIVKADLDDEAGHKRAVGRLRNRAKAEHFRVRARDHDITLISPMNDIVHEGDVNSAYLWLCGFDTNEVTA